MPPLDPIVAQAERRFLERQNAQNTEQLLERCIRAPQLPERLFHYTNADGLKGIIRTRTFWFTDIAYLNDSMEFMFGVSCLDKALSKHRLHPSLNEALRPVGSFTAAALKAYIACFSERDNLLTQWIGYGSQGSGYSIGLAGSSVSEITKNRKLHEGKFFAGRVLYDQQEIIDHFAELLRIGNDAIIDTIKEFDLNEKQQKEFLLISSMQIRAWILLAA